MEEQNQPNSQGSAPQPSVEPPASPGMADPKGGKSRLPVIAGLVIVLLLAIGGGAYALFGRGQDEPADNGQTQNQQAAQEESSEEASEESCPDGFTEFSGDNIGLHFCYPVAWGDAALETGYEEAEGHLTSGTHKLIKFSGDSTVAAGLMSKNWTHNEEMGHGGVPGEYGKKSLAQAKEAKSYLKASYVYEDDDKQFAYIDACAEFCTAGEETPHVRLFYSVIIPGNENYEVIEFSQRGGAISGSEYETPTGELDPEKVDGADLTVLFAKTDPRFTVMQQVAGTVRN